MGHEDAEIQAGAEKSGGSGCLGCSSGCVTAFAIVSLITLAVLGFVGWRIWRTVTDLVVQYTDTTPLTLPPLKKTPEEQKAVLDRVRAFGKAMDERTDPEPLVLDEDDINALMVSQNPKSAELARVGISGSDITGIVSLPIKYPGQGTRYFNAKVTFEAKTSRELLDIKIVSAEVKGQPVPKEALTGFNSKTIWNMDESDDPKFKAAVSKIKEITVKDGKVIVIPKSKAELEAEEKPRTDAQKPADSKNQPLPDVTPQPTPGGDSAEKPKPDAKPAEPDAPAPPDKPKAEPEPPAPDAKTDPKDKPQPTDDSAAPNPKNLFDAELSADYNPIEIDSQLLPPVRAQSLPLGFRPSSDDPLLHPCVHDAGLARSQPRV